MIRLLVGEGRFQEAHGLTSGWLAKSPGFHVENLLARVLVAGGIDLEEGARRARAALDMKPSSSRVSTSVSYENWARAVSYFILTEHTLGLAHWKKGEREEALPYLQQAAALAPFRRDVLSDLSRLAQELEDESR